MTNMRSDWKMVIDSPETLEKAADYYHDQHFLTGKALYDRNKAEFFLEYWRVIFEEIRQKRDFFLFQVYTAPLVKTKLAFSHVNYMRTRIVEPSDIISNIQYDLARNEIVFDCVKGTEITLEVEKLDGILEDVSDKIVDGYKFRTILYTIETHTLPKSSTKHI